MSSASAPSGSRAVISEGRGLLVLAELEPRIGLLRDCAERHDVLPQALVRRAHSHHARVLMPASAALPSNGSAASHW